MNIAARKETKNRTAKENHLQESFRVELWHTEGHPVVVVGAQRLGVRHEMRQQQHICCIYTTMSENVRIFTAHRVSSPVVDRFSSVVVLGQQLNI